MCQLTAAVLTELVVVVGTGQQDFPVALPLRDSVVLHSYSRNNSKSTIIKSTIITLPSTHVVNNRFKVPTPFNLSLTVFQTSSVI